MKTKKTVAIYGRTPAIAAALESVLSQRLKKAEFVTIERFGDRPAGAALGTVGFPGFLRTKEPVEIVSVNTPYHNPDEGAEEKAKNEAQKALLENPESDPTEIAKLFSAPESMTVIPAQSTLEAKLEVANARADWAEEQADFDDETAVEDKLTAEIEHLKRINEALQSVVPKL